jgi:hypothetical protein
MPRWSEWIRLDDGTTAIVCGSGPRPRSKPCKCGARSTKLCDYPLLVGTCDAPLCDRCAIPMGADRDFCPHHEWRLP